MSGNTDKNVVIANGTRVRCTKVDMYGFNGRDLHPSKEDVGFVGVVEKSEVEKMEDDGVTVLDRLEDAAPETDVGEYDCVCYTVRGDDGRVLELMDHEIERVKEMKLNTENIRMVLKFQTMIRCLDRDIEKAHANSLPANLMLVERATLNQTMFTAYGVCYVDDELQAPENAEERENMALRLRRELDRESMALLTARLK